MSILGIDFGATKIVTAFYDPKVQKSEIILDNEECRSTTCCLAFTKNERLFSKAAEYQAVNNPENTIFGRDIKRMIGNDKEECKIETFIKCELNADKERELKLTYRNEQISIFPEHMIAMLLSRIRENAENRLSRTFSQAVVSVPAMFNAKQRNALKTACSAAGLEVEAFLNNTTAAAVHYAVERKFSGYSKKILIFDMGATSFEVGIFEIRNNHVTTLASNGSLEIGGENFVDRLKNHYMQQLRENGIPIENDKKKLSRLRNTCEKVKIVLSTTNSADVNVETFHEGQPYEFKMSRYDFENICQDLFEKIHQIVHETAKNFNDIEEFIIIGGGGRIPKVEETLKRALNTDRLLKFLNPDEAVANGTAFYAANSDILDLPKLDLQQIPEKKIEMMKKLDKNFKNIEKFHKNLQIKLNSLENKCYKYKRTADSKELCNILTENDKLLVKEVCKRTLQWINNEKHPSKDDIITKEEILDEICFNIIEQAKARQLFKGLETTANQYFINKEYEKAIKEYNKLIEDAKDNHNSVIIYRYNRGLAIYCLNKYEEAISDFNFALDHMYDKTDLENCRFYRANCYFILQNYDLCLTDLNYLLQIYDISPEFRDKILKLKIKATLEICGKSKDFDQNLSEMKKIDSLLCKEQIIQNLKKTNTNLVGKIFLKRAICNYFVHLYEKSLEDLDEAACFLDDHQEIWKLRANCFLKLNKIDQAEQQLDLFPRNAKEDSDVRDLRIEIEIIRKKQNLENDLSQFKKFREEKAYSDLLQIIKKIKTEHLHLPKKIKNDLLRTRIEANYYLKNNQKGIEDCTKMLSKNPNYLFALRYRAKFYVVENQKEKAENDLKKILEICPEDTEATQILEKIQENNGFLYKWTIGIFKSKPKQESKQKVHKHDVNRAAAMDITDDEDDD